VLIVVSPAKSLDYESPLPTGRHSKPRLLKHSQELVREMAGKSADDISRLMGVSASLGALNHARFQAWKTPFTPRNARPALAAFTGDVYLGMDARGTFSDQDYVHAQKTLRILSGLYGVLRPLDLMQAYRLEMGTSLRTDRGKDLYAFWAGRITETLNSDLADSPGPNALINLASNEYFGSVKAPDIEGRIVTPRFLDSKNGGPYKVVSFFAKRARGAMSGWIIRERIASVAALKKFRGMGYRLDPTRSEKDQPVFVREDGASNSVPR
jgi:cytoplasmic iron level regulating protein YaaA (DUF328/UPF0246 family)